MDRNDVVARAKKYLGTDYDDLDCSAFVRATYRGWKLEKLKDNELPRTAAAQAQALYKLGLTTDVPESAKGAEIEKYLEIGDTLYWENKKDQTRFRDIHHTAIYIGGGCIIESRGKGVQICDHFWESVPWQIIMVGRPIMLIKEFSGEGEEEMIVNVTNREQAAQWQKALWDAGYPGNMNPDAFGSWGPKTEAATKAFQSAMGLSQTGVVDAATARAMWGMTGSGELNAYKAKVAEYIAGVQAAANMKI